MQVQRPPRHVAQKEGPTQINTFLLNILEEPKCSILRVAFFLSREWLTVWNCSPKKEASGMSAIFLRCPNFKSPSINTTMKVNWGSAFCYQLFWDELGTATAWWQWARWGQLITNSTYDLKQSLHRDGRIKLSIPNNSNILSLNLYLSPFLPVHLPLLHQLSQISGKLLQHRTDWHVVILVKISKLG